VLSQAIASLLEELDLLKEMIGQLYRPDASALLLESSGDNQCCRGYAEHELLSLVHFDLKVLLASVYFGNVDKPPDQITIDPFRYARATRLASFLLDKFVPFEMPQFG
jgi:hypothetical protein